jgi:hypothetical protein
VKLKCEVVVFVGNPFISRIPVVFHILSTRFPQVFHNKCEKCEMRKYLLMHVLDILSLVFHKNVHSHFTFSRYYDINIGNSNCR